MPMTVSSLRDGDLLAAVDLGSNSFHMIVARYTLGQLRIVDRLREMVRLAEGLDRDGGLHPQVQARALDCLSRFGQRLRDIPPQQVRAVATNTVRKLAQADAFLMPAERALGHAIEVVSGREEARLVYLGVAHTQPPKPGQQRLVIDIGGGSTECIIGRGMQSLERESLQMGSVATTLRFFAGGKLSRKRWKDGLTVIEAEFQQFVHRYRDLGWDEVLGSSGTIKTIGEICAAMKLTKGAVLAPALGTIRDRLLDAGHVDEIDLPGLPKERQPIIAGGILVLEGAFNALGLQRMHVSKGALREGVLYDMLGRGGADDPRTTSVQALMQRYGVDAEQARRVTGTALQLFDQVAVAWQLDDDARDLLGWGAHLHEVGLAIAHNQYQTHGAYVLAHSDIAGFSMQEQRYLAALVRVHRRGIPKSAFDALPDRLLPSARRTATLLRLAVVLHRSHEAELAPPVHAQARDDSLLLQIPARWLDARPLLKADLAGELQELPGLGIRVSLAH
ncbi:MAG: exopolyphosphatase [Pseudoxanthomonas suwonensis]|nr:MAG: exopolyphosphatase [Pseudoxanthomonas suwonensis]